MSNYELNTHYNENDISQEEYDEGVKNNFEMSIASIGDIYSKVGHQNITHQAEKYITGNFKIPSKTHNFEGSSNVDNTLEICKLKYKLLTTFRNFYVHVI